MNQCLSSLFIAFCTMNSKSKASRDTDTTVLQPDLPSSISPFLTATLRVQSTFSQVSPGHAAAKERRHLSANTEASNSHFRHQSCLLLLVHNTSWGQCFATLQRALDCAILTTRLCNALQAHFPLLHPSYNHEDPDERRRAGALPVRSIFVWRHAVLVD